MNEHENATGQFVFGTNRLEAISDGVIAIVLTLLVLDFSSIEHHLADLSQQPSAIVLAELSKAWPHLLGYILSFVLIGISWLTHHYIFHHVRRADLGLFSINLFFLMSLAFLPYPTGLLADCVGHSSSVILVFYGTAHLLVALSLLGLWLYAAHSARLIAPDLDTAVVRNITLTVASRPALYSIGIALSFLSTTAALIFFAITPVLYVVLGMRKGLWEVRKVTQAKTVPKQAIA
jgi:uncharacterized membrane protein